jgi:hypothetical protein
LALIGAGAFASGSLSAQTAPKHPAKSQRTKKLEATAQKLVAVLENGAPEEFPDFVSSRGLSFGYDTPAIALSSIKEDIARKTGLYCALFDTACLRVEGAKYEERVEKLVSSRDKINLLPQTVHISRGSATSGSAVLCVLRDDGCDSSRAVIFTFSLKDGEWKLVSLLGP